MLSFGRTVFVALMLAALAGPGRAADIRVLGVEAVGGALRPLADEFARQAGHRIVFTITSPEVVTEKIKANEIHDAVIVAEPAMDELDKDGIVNPESRVRLAAQRPTIYEGALMSDGGVPEAARDFIRYLASPEARDKWVAAGLEPLADH
jgi:ABC-type molybdate transport system substrate-binding protein